MIFAGIDVNIITHEKVLAAGAAAFGLWTWGMCYAQLHETNGRLPRVVVLKSLGLDPRTSSKLAGRLVEVSLWIENGDGSFSIANYEKKNQTSEEIKKRKEQASERVRRWREKRRNADVTPSNADMKRVRTDPEPEPDNRKQNIVCPADVPSAEPAPIPDPEKPAPRAKRATRLPEGWTPSDVTLAWARTRVADPLGVLESFRDYWHAEGSARAAKVDWDRAYRFWVGREATKPARRYANGAARHVQPATNRAWKLPSEMP